MNNSEKPSDETDMCHFAPGTGTCKLKKKNHKDVMSSHCAHGSGKHLC